ncbi:hypothetical protein HID58_048023 [Brassica napus]|uniref:CCHC-type domain-containing protein n=1 Tax=Brassica napus TaxID=3708 RepID=A0ABQ8B0X1_BRANA|nr:hypothetical protein HID58_048023 [Brassica napus]
MVMFGEMHPPDLKMLETNSGVRGSGGSFRGKSQASSSNTTEEAVEASFGLNSQTAEGVQGSKDKDSGAAVDGVNPASGNMLQQEKQKSCALGTVVENGSKKRAHVEAAEDAVCGRSVVTRVRGQGSRRGQRSRATGGSLSGKQCCNMRNYEDNTDNLRDFVCTSQIVDFSYTEDSDICGSVDVVNVTQPKDRKQQNHDDDFVDRRFTKSSSETVRCALTFATGNANVGNVVLVTPPQRNEKRSHVIEDDDEYFDPTLGIKRKLGASDYAETPRKKKKPNKCFRCFKEGHKKTTCKEPVP